VPDATTWADAAAALKQFGGDAHSSAVRAVVERGLAGALPDTPKAGDRSIARAQAMVIGSRKDAMAGARDAAARRGYHPIVLPEPVTGEAREAALSWFQRVKALVAAAQRPACVVSSGETTVRVTGSGTGGRNLEFALALAEGIAHMPSCAVTSIGTDGIDGSSGVAGGLVDSTTMSRAGAAGLHSPEHFLAANDSFAFFAPLGDVVRLGRTDTNVGDLQVLLID